MNVVDKPSHNVGHCNIISVSYCFESKRFVCGTNYGFFVFSLIPFKIHSKRDLGCSVKYVEMHKKCRVFAIVGIDNEPHSTFQRNKVVIWDNDYGGRIIGEVTFRSEVMGVKLTDNRIIVSLNHKCYIYDFNDLKCIAEYNRSEYEYGNLDSSPLSDKILCAFPIDNIGTIKILRHDLKDDIVIKSAKKKPSELITINPKGTKIARVENNGMDIFVADINSSPNDLKLTRGKISARVLSMDINEDGSLLAIISDRKTVHIFGLNDKTHKKFGFESSEVKNFIVLKFTDKTILTVFKDNECITYSLEGGGKLLDEKNLIDQLDLVED